MAGNGLFEFVQIFVIGNGTYTKYYANTTRESHLKDKNDIKVQKSSHSFEFTSFWADLKNNPISDLCDFAKTFFLLNIHFCVFSVGIACLMWIESCLSCDLIKSPLRRKSCKKSLWAIIISFMGAGHKVEGISGIPQGVARHLQALRSRNLQVALRRFIRCFLSWIERT